MGSFRCPACGMDCCTCSGCQPQVTPGGKHCCSRCYQGVLRTELNAKQVLEDIVNMTNRIQNRPNERLYQNG